jgi:hypothetical protein
VNAKAKRAPPVEIRIADRRADGCVTFLLREPILHTPAPPCALCATPRNVRQGVHVRLVCTEVIIGVFIYVPTAQLFKVLDLTHEAVVNGVPVTKRCAQ